MAILSPVQTEREKRPLRMAPPEEYRYRTSDGVELRLTRYRGGTKGPVIAAPGFGTSRMAYLIDTLDTTFPELLYEHGYDVWVFDYRASPDLPSAATQFSVDDIATKDWPATVDKVLAETGAESVQVVAHCVGSMSFLMGMLAGLQGVRGAVSSNLPMHPIVPPLNRLRVGAHFATLFPLLGADTLTTETDPEAAWSEQLFNAMLKWYPTHERCDNPTCHRVHFIYGEVYKHAQLNEATHWALDEMFGVVNLETFQHISTMIRAGHIVDKDGNDVYLPHLDRLAIPLAFIHGDENGLFLQEGSALTYNLLCEANGEELYARHVIPNYAHMDCFIGKDASRDVFPIILTELEKGNPS